MKKTIIILLLILTIKVFSEEKTAKLNLYKNKLHTDTTSRQVLGGLTEQLEDFISGNSSFWSQEITNRGFDNIVFNSDFTSSSVTNWKLYNNTKDSSKLFLFSGSSNQYGAWCLNFTQYNNDSLLAYQDFLLSDSSNYDFYLYGFNWNVEPAKVSIMIQAKTIDNSIVELGKELIYIDKTGWQKYSVKLKINREIKKIINSTSSIILKSENNSNFLIDEVSLMPDDNVNGVRREHYNLYKQIKFGNLRYPGGWFADSKFNDWENSILPIDQRKAPIYVSHDNVPQRVEFGLLEYIHFCKDLKIEPYITVKFENGNPVSASNLIEFCNGDTNSIYGKKRMILGDTAKYNVKYWEIGNEQWSDKFGYATRYIDFYNKMKQKDSTILTIIDGTIWDQDSFDSLMSVVREKCDLFGYHSAKMINSDILNKDSIKYLYTTDASGEQWNLDMLNKKYQNFSFKLNPKLKFIDSEWWSGTLGASWLIDTNILNSTLMAGLWNINTAMLFMNNPEMFTTACRTIGIGMIRRTVNKKGQRSIYPTPGFQGLTMISNHFGPTVHYFDLEREFYHIYDPYFWVQDSPYVESLITSSQDTMFIALINKYPDKELNFKINADNFPVYTHGKMYELWSPSYSDANTEDEPLKLKENEISNVNIQGGLKLKPHSFNILAIPIVKSIKGIEFKYIDSINSIEEEIPSKSITKNNFFVNFDIYSNTINLNSKDIYKSLKFELYDLNGRIIHNGTIDNLYYSYKIDYNLNTGVYYLKLINSDNEFVVLPLMVQK